MVALTLEPFRDPFSSLDPLNLSARTYSYIKSPLPPISHRLSRTFETPDRQPLSHQLRKSSPSSPTPATGRQVEDLRELHDPFSLDDEIFDKQPASPHRLYKSAVAEYIPSPPWISPYRRPLNPLSGTSPRNKSPAPVEQLVSSSPSYPTQDLLKSLVVEMTDELERGTFKAFMNGYRYAMKSLLGQCNYHCQRNPEFYVDGPRLSPSMRDVISLLATGEPEQPTVPTTWVPPTFDTADDVVYDLCKKLEHIVPLGFLNGEFLEISLQGYVLCQGVGENDIHDLCSLTLRKNGTEKKIICYTLGTVAATGTAVLLDKEGNVWLYNPPNPIDKCLPNFPEQAVIALHKGESGSMGRYLILDDVYDAEIEVLDDED